LENHLIKKIFNKADNQLLMIEDKKIKIKKEIYFLYDLYLKIIRSQIGDSCKKGVSSLLDYSSTENDDKIRLEKSLENKVIELVNRILPFLTIEQLSISKNLDKSLFGINDYQEDESLISDINYIVEGYQLFNHSEKDSYLCDYYQLVFEEKKDMSIDLDNNYFLSNKFETTYQDNKNFVNSFMTLSFKKEDYIQLNIEFESEKDNNLFSKNLIEIFEWINFIDSSIEELLKQLSIEINNFITLNIMNKDLNLEFINYIFDNSFLVTNPSPFVILFDITNTQYIDNKYLGNNNYSKIYLFQINLTELEFLNMKISVIKNKINEIKNNLNLLIKKEKYWNKKKKDSIKNLSLINKL
tara:strand:+ start:1381 stop:2445 length:1065 start_codon:yes stop_codon:yes gene_type:complete